MAKTKIYFWLKVDKKFFDNLFIKRLKNMPGGYTMTVIYIRLMLESLEDDCILYYEGYFDSLVQELALKLDVSEDDINMTVAYFTRCGLIQIDDDGHATLSQAKAMVESETNWSKYKREQRKQAPNVARLENVQNSWTNSNSCPTEIEKENRVNSKSNNLYLDNILSGNPDFTFPTWLEETGIKDLEKTKYKELWIPIVYLNQVANKRYKFVDKTKRLLLARFKEGYTLEDFKQVIDIKTAEWKDSPEFSKYLRPETLFGSKFDGYLNQKPKTIKGKSEDNFPDLPF
ncbi:TPA: conserved phage C-terminal domain-containing protein [Streptococcus pneumoniae]|uniref:Putative phage-related chromosomal island protein n=3 Tax=Streptococcus pneumoniae TaxID=1313 RepID=A0A098AP30_STREE|nr:conserved phage C-terminal domain-containing protein [Streptococcus pneumoniae]MBW4996010.1 conserved phage C-terminal domain-containing protein [Streptococcus pneumoniae]MBW5061814.1 conserved phage C-terminal domain-containing protein [Streptococcus pneumoniae]MBW5065994.1 conserved phage C-terminal domain-containing protein [Streptococcus pneumoniae]MBW5097687.1 conserved phage C-terminal domain-containing protein [Streptococcus pneumoniae]MBW5231877.1 conserved phage C-terminal domain-c